MDATDATGGPQAVAQSLDGSALRRALAVSAVGTALNGARQWLDLSVRRAVADAVLAAIEPATEHCIHDAGIHHRHHTRPVDDCPWCSDTGTADRPDTIKTGDIL